MVRFEEKRPFYYVIGVPATIGLSTERLLHASGNLLPIIMA